MNDPHRVEAAIARNLLASRTRRGWSLAQLAARSGVSKGMLVQIEQAQTNPSIATLCKLANALGVALPRLVEVADEPVVRRITRADVAWLWKGRGKGSAAGLVGGIEDPVSVELWDWRIAARDGYDAVAHPPGTREMVFVLEGDVMVIVDGGEVPLEAGECAVFRADRPHRYASRNGRAAHFVMVVIEQVGLPPGPRRARAGRGRRPVRGNRV